jgi:hypothetical protein
VIKSFSLISYLILKTTNDPGSRSSRWNGLGQNQCELQQLNRDETFSISGLREDTVSADQRTPLRAISTPNEGSR